jgi:hypothetical protein
MAWGEVRGIIAKARALLVKPADYVGFLWITDSVLPAAAGIAPKRQALKQVVLCKATNRQSPGAPEKPEQGATQLRLAIRCTHDRYIP